ncbi:LysR substrate-binding domain-containing protein [Inquilinus sp. Marseille-Q2685]|uniref:LysR substrate-binding domain-containing protein n=1 Tax=Inquilinus sp. Marseille-Q2685 TaxID=2866581 RepID=UPI001CE3C12B|nr:LysR substrate-binding domain-containing protein [Inquilinus sp. Marseille-Q2685]
MPTVTRRLPPLESLRAFEAVARLGSFKRAAEELAVTASAVSHRVADLEAELGVALLVRHVRRVELSVEGEALAAGMGRALQEIRRTVAGVDRRGRARLRVSAIPSHAVRWLAPRLQRFRAQHPDIDIDIMADLALVDLSQRTADIALRFGGGAYPNLRVEPLMADAIFPVASPGYIAAAGPVATPADILRLDRLIDTTARDDQSGAHWQHWFETNGLPLDAVNDGMNLNGSLLTLEAAVNGLGVAIARRTLVEEDIRTGRLLRLLDAEIPTNWNHYAVTLPSLADWQPVRRFIDWLKAEAGGP